MSQDPNRDIFEGALAYGNRMIREREELCTALDYAAGLIVELAEKAYRDSEVMRRVIRARAQEYTELAYRVRSALSEEKVR